MRRDDGAKYRNHLEAVVVQSGMVTKRQGRARQWGLLGTERMNGLGSALQQGGNELVLIQQHGSNIYPQHRCMDFFGVCS